MEEGLIAAVQVNRAPQLRRGDLIRVVSPSLPSLAYSRGSVAQPVARLASLGLRCDFGANAFAISDDGRSAGSPQERADDIHAAFADPEVAGVLCAVGGLSTHEVLPYLDADLLRANPKPLIGRSDHVNLNAFLFAKAGVTSYNGVTFVTQFGDSDVVPQSMVSFADVLLGSGPLRLVTSPVRSATPHPTGYTDEWHQWPSPERPGTDMWLRPGRAVGRLLGGEIGIVSDLIAGGLLDLDGAVFWLDIAGTGADYFEEQLERLEPLVAGMGIAALLVADNPTLPFATWAALIERSLPRLGRHIDGPVLIGGDIGHYQPAWLLPYGDFIEVDSRCGITIQR